MITAVKLFLLGTDCPTQLIKVIPMTGRPMVGDHIVCDEGRTYVVKEVYLTEDGYECYVETRFLLTPSEMALS